MSGINGALGLYSTVKGLLDSTEYKKKQEQLLKSAKNDENTWYRKNYYGNFLNDTATQAAIKRVENSLKRNNEQERARGVITGTTAEHAIARNEQGLRSLDNVITNIASANDAKKREIDAMHRRNKSSLMNNEYNSLSLDERMAKSAASSGYNLLQNALLGVEWGREGKR
ncbi:MAG: hypothetical protein IJY44_04235 [Bacteroidaceae bacterium]|nr:hypothetical protein [Bacteroidaceae bacterium]